MGGVALSEQDRIKAAAFNITAAFEGSKSYTNYQTYDSGIISYGRFQFTLASGSLGRVLESYLAVSTTDTAGLLMGYQTRVDVKDATLRKDASFKALMIRAAEEEAMKQAQDSVVQKSYWVPAQDSIISRGIVTPLGQALLFDMAVQHGPAHKHTQTAEQQLGAPPKSMLGENGLTEEQLIRQVAQVRKSFLYGFADANNLPGARKRADFWVDLVASDDWQLQGDADGNVFVYGKPVQVKNPTQTSSMRAEPGEPVRGTFTTSRILSVRKTPDINSDDLGRVRKGRVLTVSRRHVPSFGEEWLFTEVGWVARQHPSYPGEVFGELKLN